MLRKMKAKKILITILIVIVICSIGFYYLDFTFFQIICGIIAGLLFLFAFGSFLTIITDYETRHSIRLIGKMLLLGLLLGGLSVLFFSAIDLLEPIKQHYRQSKDREELNEVIANPSVENLKSYLEKHKHDSRYSLYARKAQLLLLDAYKTGGYDSIRAIQKNGILSSLLYSYRPRLTEKFGAGVAFMTFFLGVALRMIF